MVSVFSKLLLSFPIFFFFLSRTVKSLRFYPTCRLTGQPSTVAGMLAEFVRLLGQRQGTLLPLEMLQPEFQHLHQFLKDNFPQGSAKKPGWCLNTVRCVLGEESQALGTLLFYNVQYVFLTFAPAKDNILGSKQICPLPHAEIPSLSFKAVCYISVSKITYSKNTVPLPERCKKVRDSLENYLSTLFVLYLS